MNNRPALTQPEWYSLSGDLNRLPDRCDASQDEVDAGEELLAVVMSGQLRRQLTHERVPSGVELRPLGGYGHEHG